MDMKYVAVRNCRWGNEEHTIIDCEVDFADFKEEWVPFSANSNDFYNHSREIFNRAVAGEFGEIQPNRPKAEDVINPEHLRFLQEKNIISEKWKLDSSTLE
jgi:hypothetical protein